MSYTLAITSCNRMGLLQRTLDSFLAHADVLPHATVILEDSAAPKPEWLGRAKYRALGKGKWKSNGQRRGQIFSIDSLYDEIETEYVFHCEDDWLFTRGGFIRPSFDILNRHPQVSCVSLRGKDCNGHPLTNDWNGVPFHIQLPGWQGGWGGYSFNPGLRRISDLSMFGGSFGRFVGYGQHGCGHELKISQRMLDLGFRIAVLDEQPHVKHIGQSCSRAIETLPASPRILIAVPATRSYNYGAHTSGINRVTVGRVAAIRDTWFKDVAAFPNVDARFFYGEKDWPHFAYPDERFLDCPDDYTRLPEKIRAIYRYALDNGYDFLVKADDDTALYVDRLLRSGFDLADQMGYYPCQHPRNCFCYATGMCYTLSRRAMECALGFPLLDPAKDSFYWAEDYTLGKALRSNGITPKGHPGWFTNPVSHYVKPPFKRGTVAAHSVTPEDMRAWYATR